LLALKYAVLFTSGFRRRIFSWEDERIFSSAPKDCRFITSHPQLFSFPFYPSHRELSDPCPAFALSSGSGPFIDPPNNVLLAHKTGGEGGGGRGRWYPDNHQCQYLSHRALSDAVLLLYHVPVGMDGGTRKWEIRKS
ncbi:hypothetical protein BgiMline_036257, partial [Biomphalaria glabrata]